MRYFIRHYALRLGMGESAPWVVEDELVKKFNLPSKFSDFLLDPHKVLHTQCFFYVTNRDTSDVSVLLELSL